MTAVVGILNKGAVAIAADSAVTMSNEKGRKILNRANKIFTLSKRHPVGVMLFNSASFMGTPWEIIIKMYRDKLKEKSFGTVQEYQDDFIKYLKKQPFFAHPANQKISLLQFCFSLMEFVNTLVFRENGDLRSLPPADSRVVFLKKLEEKFDKFIVELRIGSNPCRELADFTKERFEAMIKDDLPGIIDQIYTRNDIVFTDELRIKVLEFLFLAFKHAEDKSPYTGLVFAGFGNNEIYPTLNCVNVSFAVDKSLRYYQQTSYSVSEEQKSAIFPFAQTDVIDTILTGSDPNLWNVFTGNFEKFISKYNDLILQTVKETSPELEQRIHDINVKSLVNEFVASIEQVRQNDVIDPMLMAVGTLSKEDLAEMAESLIYLTYLKRRFTFAEESVGGPVDVAVISKGDGFIWMKRKHYFKPELNTHFFNNYFK